ncbi:MAG: conjugal transfer protein TraH [bacterium]
MYNFKLKIASVVLSFFMVITSTAGIVGWYRTPYAYAGINSFVSAGLSGANSVSNVEGSGEYHTQGENIYTLGSAEVRFNTVGQNLQLFTISPPNFSIGCSGIDATFGAFAMLGSSLMQALQSIIQSGQVLVFAFNMVLGVLCKQCEHIMNQIESIANKLNGLNFNSCQAAEAAGNIAGAEIGNMITKGQNTGNTNAYAPTIATASSKGGIVNQISGYINDINTVMNCGSTPADATALVENGFKSCGAMAAANEFFFGSLLRQSLSEAHIGLINGSGPGSGGANEMLGILRGSFTGDLVGYQSASKQGVPVVRYVPMHQSTETQIAGLTNATTKTFNALLMGGNLHYIFISAVTPAQPVSLASLETTGSDCFPGFMYYYQGYLNQVTNSYFAANETTPPSTACSSAPTPAPLTQSEMDNFITNSTLPVILIAKLAYVNQDPTILNTAAKAMALGYIHNIFTTLLHGVETNIMADKNLDQKQKTKLFKEFTGHVDIALTRIEVNYQSALSSLNIQQDSLTYYQSINKAWVSSLSQFGLSGAYNYNP